MEFLKEALRNPESQYGRRFDLCVMVLIIVSIITLSIETLPSITDSQRKLLFIIEVIITFCFTIEYVLRISASERKLSYIFSFYGLVDLLAIVPFYLGLGVDLRGVRAFRLFRLIRILKLGRYTEAMERFSTAFRAAKEEATLFFFATIILLYLAAVGIYYFEHEAQPEVFSSIPHSLWWAIATLTTVGYGDIYPITAGGKAFTFVVLILGLGIVAVPAGLVASALAEARNENGE